MNKDKPMNTDEFEIKIAGLGGFNIMDIRFYHGAYIRRLIKNRLPSRSSDLARERVFGDVTSVASKKIKEGKLRATHGVKSIKTYLKRSVNARCINYCRDYDPETDMRKTPEGFGGQREVAKRRRERWYTDEAETLDAFKTFGMDFQKDVKHKEVFLLHMKGAKRSKIAKITGLSILQVKNRYDSTIRKLKRNSAALLAHADYTQNPGRYYDQKRGWLITKIEKESLPKEIRGLAGDDDEND